MLQFGETDDIAVSRNQVKLNEEAVKPNANKATVLSLQRPSFRYRREFILSGLDSIAVVLEQHPVLCRPFAVSNQYVGKYVGPVYTFYYCYWAI